MSEKPEQSGRGWAVPVFALVLLAGLYVGGYFYFSTYRLFRGGYHERMFRSETIAECYRPLVWIEAEWRKERVALSTYYGPLQFYHPEPRPE